MLSVQQQLANRAKRLRIDSLKKQKETSDKRLLSGIFSQWRAYKRFYEQLAVIQRFIRSIWYIIKMRILKKNHREPDSATHSALQFDRFIILEQNREAGISLSRDLKNNELTRLRVFILGFVRTHNPVVDEPAFIQKLREMLGREEFDYIQNLMGSQSFIEFFESTKKQHMIFTMDARLLEVCVFIFPVYCGFFTTYHLNDFQKVGSQIQNQTSRLSSKNCAQSLARKFKKKRNIIAKLWKWDRQNNQIIFQNIVLNVVSKQFKEHASMRNVC